ncbi:hypothetical protein DA70_16240 [Pandoraea pnomenusa]|uniref:hypothetical protein n=1 Tax=Pandoraea pnomenusa TaxID=93220 RepID=UPI0004376085|nr:hypothetical protein [Pandoraea pnomenusa]AHN77549.1 hypothetical protein DA70_16240 [Pandoraea pnomenusa]
MLKDTLDVAWRFAPAALFPAALFLWIHLKSIHWTSLFQYSAMTGSGLAYLLSAAILLALAAMLQFALPSVMLIGTVSVYRLDRKIPKAVPRLYQCAMGGWILGFALVIGFDSDRISVICALAFVAALIYALARRDELGLRAGPNGWRHKPIVCAVGLACAAATTMLVTSAPLLLAFRLAARYVHGGIGESVVGILVCAGTVVMSLLPGYMYVNARTWRVGVYQPVKLALLGAFFLTYVVLMVAAMLVPVSSTVLRLAGIYSNELQTFVILQPNLADAARTAGLSVSDDGKLTLLRGYVRYDFGGTRLLCSTSFDPEKVSVDAIRQARDDKAPDPGVVAGAGCVQASTSELRALRLPS